jgi:hypothetical protein
MGTWQRADLDKYVLQAPKKKVFTKEEAIALAKSHKKVTYLPHWMPDDWVIAAILEAANGQTTGE